jgi:hypothetical protein
VNELTTAIDRLRAESIRTGISCSELLRRAFDEYMTTWEEITST